MANEYLTFKNLAIGNTIISLLFGIGFVLMPKDILDMYDVKLTDSGNHIAQLFGAALVTIGIIVWFIRDMQPSSARQGISLGLIVGDTLGTLLSLMDIFNDDTDANALQWLNVLIYVLLAVGFGYFFYLNYGETSKEAAE